MALVAMAADGKIGLPQLAVSYPALLLASIHRGLGEMMHVLGKALGQSCGYVVAIDSGFSSPVAHDGQRWWPFFMVMMCCLPVLDILV